MSLKAGASTNLPPTYQTASQHCPETGTPGFISNSIVQWALSTVIHRPEKPAEILSDPTYPPNPNPQPKTNLTPHHELPLPRGHFLRPRPDSSRVSSPIIRLTTISTPPHSSEANNPLYRGYSAHEHTVLYSNLTSTALPQDIIIETLVSVLIVSIGLVLSAQKLKPISWREWAGEIERDGGARNPYLSLEERYGFWDIRVSLRST